MLAGNILDAIISQQNQRRRCVATIAFIPAGHLIGGIHASNNLYCARVVNPGVLSGDVADARLRMKGGGVKPCVQAEQHGNCPVCSTCTEETHRCPGRATSLDRVHHGVPFSGQFSPKYQVLVLFKYQACGLLPVLQ